MINVFCQSVMLTVLLLFADISKSSPSSSLENATHYWSMRDFETDKKNGKPTRSGKATLNQFNNVMSYNDSQLGPVLKLRDESWLRIDGVSKAITMLTNHDGITLSFWMKFEAGDYIMSAGGYLTKITTGAPGFRLQRDPETNFFKLEVVSQTWSGSLFIEHFPKRWFHFLFTWSQNGGLKLYINGIEKLYTGGETQKHKKSVPLDESSASSNLDKILFASEDVENKMPNKGKFQISHIAIWKKAFNADKVKLAYKANVLSVGQLMCCYLKKHACHQITNKTECICTDHKNDEDLEVQMEKCQRKEIFPTVCSDKNEHCGKLVNDQEFYCKNYEYYARKSCRRTCNLCIRQGALLMGPNKRLSNQTLIFSILGCIGGLILLLGITFYFWKVYRTRCHGTFVPPFKSVSLLDVSDQYDDEKWPHKFVDSNAFYIKDVPPKKRALPLIPAKNSQSNYRYQPPEFD